MPLSVYLLSFCTATAFTCASLLITISALIGFDLAPVKTLTTLPMALQFLAVMTCSIPASLLMARVGRRNGFMLAAVIGITGAVLALWAITHRSFSVFCIATFCFGAFTAFANYYRFTAIETVDAKRKNRAISFVMAGGVLAAFIGPNLANWSQHVFSSQQYAGAFVVLIVVYLLNLIAISQLRLPPATTNQTTVKGRSIWKIMLQPVFIVAVICEMFGYGTMNLIMTSTPLAMHAAEHNLASTALVIQWHVLAMFAPSFFTGHLIDRLGLTPVLAIGVLMGFLSVFINLSGTSVAHFVTGLITLGLCWNFMFVGGTTLLTEAYKPEEKSATQAANDFLVFSTVTVTALCAGGIHHLFGWQIINLSVLPLLVMATFAIAWLHRARVSPKAANA